MNLMMFSQEINIGTPYSISKNINTDGDEFLPIISADGNTLYFCGYQREDNLGLEDIYVSYFENGQWTKPEIAEGISTAASNDAALAVSADGNSMIMFKDGEIYTTNKTKTGWGELVKFEELNYKDWNADAFYTSDGNAILFSSGDRFDGNYDIFVIEKKNDGTWSEPINLGDTINKGTFSRSPFLHYDMKTLYFSTAAYDGEGELDIYKTTRLSETSWTEWSSPINLGPEINNESYDWGFKIVASGEKAIYNVTIDGNNDIYMVDLPKEIQPEKVVVVTGKVTDTKKLPLDADIIWEDLETGEKVGNLKSDPVTGEYIITLPKGKNYGFFVSKESYYPVSENLNLKGDIANYELIKDFVLKNVVEIKEGNETIQLNNLFFETGKHNLKIESYPELNRLADFIKENPEIKIEISGHTDNVGSDEYNQTLSERRANEVKNYLTSKGCNSKQLTAVGYGESKPVASNNTDDGKAKNRRVEFKVIK